MPHLPLPLLSRLLLNPMGYARQLIPLLELYMMQEQNSPHFPLHFCRPPLSGNDPCYAHGGPLDSLTVAMSEQQYARSVHATTRPDSLQ